MTSSSPPVSADCELTILMPCLNEAETIERCIIAAREFLNSSQVKGEILIADNGSTDGSQALATKLGARVVAVPLRGYGAALYYGSLAAQGRFIIMGDSDASYDFSNLMPFVEKLRAGFDLVMGNRFAGGIKPGAMPWKNRYIGNPVLSGIGKLFFKCPANDFHCGLRGYSASAFRQMDLRTTGMEFASEMVIKATLRGMRITEVPTTLSPDGRSRPPHLKPWRDGWRHLRFMLLYSPRWLFLYPGAFLIISGLILGLRLVISPLSIGGVVFDVHTLLYSAMAVMIGFFAFSFAIFTKIYAIAEGLLPADPRIDRLRQVVTLERGLIVGSLLLVAGLIGSVASVLHWQSQGFGPLDSEVTLRAVIPAFLAIAIGVQIIFSSFFLSVLDLKVRPLEVS